jgi:hypothetical protein
VDPRVGALRCDAQFLTARCVAPELGDARAAALALVERKALTPISDFCNGEGDAGLELHFEIDLSARNLRMQLNHSARRLCGCGRCSGLEQSAVEHTRACRAIDAVGGADSLAAARSCGRVVPARTDAVGAHDSQRYYASESVSIESIGGRIACAQSLTLFCLSVGCADGQHIVRCN